VTTIIEPDFTDNGESIFMLRYSMKDDDQKPSETGGEAMWRVAINVSSVNALYVAPHGDGPTFLEEVFPMRTARRRFDYLVDQDKNSEAATARWGTSNPRFLEVMEAGWWKVEEQAERYVKALASLTFVPNSPTWTGAGTELGQLAACYVLQVDDDLTVSDQSIFQTMRVAAGIEQTGGGNGFGFGRTRPHKALVKRSKGQASGPIGWLMMYDFAFGQIGQGGVRSGANMGVLPIWHPDVLTRFEGKPGWIEIKGKAGQEGYLANFNISTAITDDFFLAVAEDDSWDFTFGDTIYETRPAREVFRLVAENAWVRGDPGNLFVDQANRDNPNPTRYTLEATNPCGEQWLPPYGNCCLGHVNIGKFADWDGSFDWVGFAEAIRTGHNFLDDVVDANQYVPQFPELQEMAYNERRIGLGGMGLHDAMLKLGVRYGSTDGLEFASQVNEFMAYHANVASIERARERGAFPWIENSKFDPILLDHYGPGAEVTLPGAPGTDLEGKDVTFKLWERPTPFNRHDNRFGRPNLDWANVERDMAESGRRNSTLLTWAPTGTTSNVAGCEAAGCEPVFALIYTRTVVQGEEKIKLDYLSPLFSEALIRAGVDEETCENILRKVKDNNGSCQGVPEVPESVQYAFVVAADIPVKDHIWTQAVLQRFTDNAISKTINMPNEATVEDVEESYKLAHSLGCKGITIYRQGSRDFEILTTRSDTDEAIADGLVVHGDVIPMPIPDYAAVEGLPTRTYPVSTPFGTLQVYITERVEEPGRPFDLRVSLGKSGSDKLADVETIGRLTSLLLRSRVPVPTVVDQLEGIGGQTQQGYGPNRVRSVADALGKLLRRVYLGGDYEPVVSISVTETVREVESKQQQVHDPQTVCPKCHNATVVMESGCKHCEPRLGGCGDYTVCD
jgi:ribonucleoside-diphosphate reductase alpha chain